MPDLYIREIDLHGMSLIEGRKYLNSELNKMPRHIKEVHVIHGYQGGKALQKMVRQNFGHKRIDKVVLSMNQGMTVFMLKV